MRRIAGWAAIVVAASLLLAGCMISTEPTDAAERTSEAGELHGDPTAADLPADVPNDPALRANVALADCSITEGGWRAAGTAVNPGKTDANYTITVFFTTAQASVLASADTTVTLEKGETAEWSVRSEFTAPPDTVCVLRGVG